MKGLRILAIGAALIAGGSALASAQPSDHRDGRSDDRGGNRSFNNDRGGNRGNNFNRGGDRDNRGGKSFDRGRDDRGFKGGRNVPNGIYWRDNDRRGDRDDRHFFGDRDGGRVIVGEPYYVGETRFFNGYNWYWDGYNWCRRDHGVVISFRF